MNSPRIIAGRAPHLVADQVEVGLLDRHPFANRVCLADA